MEGPLWIVAGRPAEGLQVTVCDIRRSGPGPSADRRDVPPGRAGCRIRDRSSRTSALIEGPELKHLLAEQLGLDVRVGLDPPRPVAALDAASRNSRGRAMSGLLGSPMRCWYLARTWAIAPMKETHPCLEPRYGDRGPPRPAPQADFTSSTSSKITGPDAWPLTISRSYLQVRAGPRQYHGVRIHPGQSAD
jgi:hypothetical protein